MIISVDPITYADGTVVYRVTVPLETGNQYWNFPNQELAQEFADDYPVVQEGLLNKSAQY